MEEENNRPIEDVIGELLDHEESWEQIPDLINEVLEGIPYEDIPFADVPEEGNTVNDTPDRNESSANRSRVERRSNDTYAKFDPSVDDVQVEPEKINQIKKEVIEEGKEKEWSGEQVQKEISSRIADLRNQLTDIRSDIEHYKSLIDKMSESANPVHLRSMTTFQLLRYETDAACRNYIKAGGQVGEDCFMKSGVTSSQIGMSLIDVFRSNSIESAIISKATGSKVSFDDIYRGTSAGKTIVGKIASPFAVFGDAVGHWPGSVLQKMFEKGDKGMDWNPTSKEEAGNDMEQPDIEDLDDIDVSDWFETDFDDMESGTDPQDNGEQLDVEDVVRPEQDTVGILKETVDEDEEHPVESVNVQGAEELAVSESEDDNPDEVPSDIQNDILDVVGETEEDPDDTSNDSEETKEPREEVSTEEEETSEMEAEDADSEPDQVIEQKDEEESRKDEQEVTASESEGETADIDGKVEDAEHIDVEEPKTEGKVDAVTVETSLDDETDADVDDNSYEDGEMDEHPSDKENKLELEQQAEDIDVQKPEDLTDDMENQDTSLENTTDLAMEGYQELDSIEPAKDMVEQAMDIVEHAVESIEAGTGEDIVMGEVSDQIAEFFNTQVSDETVSMEDIINTIADTVHEIASVFEDPTEAIDGLLQGISDEAVTDAIVQQVENVNAEMTVEATGTFGQLEYDSSGNIVNSMELEATDLFMGNDIEVDDVIKDLETHMDAAVDSPEIQEILSVDEQPYDMDTGMDSLVDRVSDSVSDMLTDVSLEGAEESLVDILSALL